MTTKKAIIPDAPTAQALSEKIWEIVARRHVDRQIAIEAVEMVLDTLRLDARIDDDLGLATKGKPS